MRCQDLVAGDRHSDGAYAAPAARARQRTGDLPPVHIRSENNIFASVSDVPLITMVGTSEASFYQGLLAWNGQNNIYDGFERLWRIESTTSVDVVEFDLSFWSSYWSMNEQGREKNALATHSIWADDTWQAKAIEHVLLSDLALDRRLGVENSAIDAASDGADLGVDLRLLDSAADVTP